MVQGCTPALKLSLPSLISSWRFCCPGLTATALTAPCGTSRSANSPPAGTSQASSSWIRAHILRSGRSRENLPPAKPLGYLASSISQTFMSRFFASFTAILIIFHQPSERYSYGKL